MAFTPDIHFHEMLPSTMDEARTRAKAGAAEGTVVQTGVQTAGRGRSGKIWESPRGNLYMTVILRPQMSVRDCPQISFVAALALADTIADRKVTLKWPNDVFVDGKKVAGILLEMESGTGIIPEFMLVGIGVNVATAPEDAAVLNTDLDATRDALLKHLGVWYARWQENGFKDIRAAWLEKAHGLGTQVTIQQGENLKLSGKLEGIDEEGYLVLLEKGGNRRLVASGTLRFNPA